MEFYHMKKGLTQIHYATYTQLQKILREQFNINTDEDKKLFFNHANLMEHDIPTDVVIHDLYIQIQDTPQLPRVHDVRILFQGTKSANPNPWPALPTVTIFHTQLASKQYILDLTKYMDQLNDSKVRQASDIICNLATQMLKSYDDIQAHTEFHTDI